MTKYIDLRENKTPLKGVTRFIKLVGNDCSVCVPSLNTIDWENVTLLATDLNGVSVFLASIGFANILYLGYAGAEFNQ